MKTRHVALVAAVLLCSVRDARSQQAREPFRGVFRAADDRPTRAQSLVLSWSLEAAKDRDSRVHPESGDVDLSRAYTDAVGEVVYGKTTRSFLLAARTGGALRRDADGGEAVLFKDVTSVSISAPPRRRWIWKANATLTRAPYSLLPIEGPSSIENGPLLSPTTDNRTTEYRTVTEDAGVGLSRRFGRTLTIAGDYAARISRLSIASSQLISHHGSLRVERQVGAASVLSGGYSEQIGTLSGAVPASLDSREVDLGFDYRPNGTARHRVGFGAGSAMVSDGDRVRRSATGYGRVERSFGRSWSTRIEYRRGIDFIPAIAHPLVADSFTVTAGGFFGRRIDVLGFGGIWSDSDATGGVARFRSQRLGARARFALSRTFAIYGEFLRFDYVFDSVLDAPAALAADERRQGFRLGVMSRLPFGR